MYIHEIKEALESSVLFKEWIKENADYYLVHLFFMTDMPPQIGYFSKKTDMIITFDVNKKIKMNEPSAVFKEKQSIDSLDLDKVSLDRTDAMKRFTKLRDEKYPAEKLKKEIMVLQVIDGKPVYNITYFTETFKTLNVKLDASSGEILSDDLASLISM